MPTERSNVVTITDDSKTITSISFVSNSIMITQGQPSDSSATISQKNNVFEIELDAGRQKSDPVANQFNALSGGEVHEYAPSGGGGTPDQLNFFFEVTLNFQASDGTTGSANVYLGQGSFGGTTNNWWIGGGIVYNNNGSAELHAPVGSNIVILPLSGDNESFKVKLGRTHKAYPIEHVFVLMLENHSFDNIFAMSGIAGITAATTSNSNSANGVTYNVKSGAPTTMPTDPGHEFTDVVQQLAGSGVKYPSGGPYPAINNSGFASNYATTTTEGTGARRVGNRRHYGRLCHIHPVAGHLPIGYRICALRPLVFLIARSHLAEPFFYPRRLIERPGSQPHHTANVKIGNCAWFRVSQRFHL